MSMPLTGKETVDALADHWGKLFAIYLYREGIQEIIISSPEIEAIGEDPTKPTIVVQELEDGLHIKILPLTEACELARKNKHRGLGKS